MRAAKADRPSHLSSHETIFLQKGCDLKVVDNKLNAIKLGFLKYWLLKKSYSPSGPIKVITILPKCVVLRRMYTLFSGNKFIPAIQNARFFADRCAMHPGIGIATRFLWSVEIISKAVVPLFQKRRCQRFLQGPRTKPHQSCSSLRHLLRCLRESQCIPRIAIHNAATLSQEYRSLLDFIRVQIRL